MSSFVIFSSGRGSGFEALARAHHDRVFRGKLLGLVCNIADAPVLQRAQKLDIDVLLVESKGLTREAHEEKLLEEMKRKWGTVDFIVLSGYFKILTPKLIEAFRDPRGFSRIVNIHPSILPAFPGLNSYAQSFEHGCKISGCTVHLVENEVDSGPILAQESFSIEGYADASVVESRGLGVEHRLYPETLKWFFEGQFKTEIRKGRLCVLPS